MREHWYLNFAKFFEGNLPRNVRPELKVVNGYTNLLRLLFLGWFTLEQDSSFVSLTYPTRISSFKIFSNLHLTTPVHLYFVTCTYLHLCVCSLLSRRRSRMQPRIATKPIRIPLYGYLNPKITPGPGPQHQG